jgi:hypothetical protein
VLGFEDPHILEALDKLAEGLWDLPRMAGGFVDELHDVEHSAEDSSDSIMPLMMNDIDDPRWLAKAEGLANMFVDLWTKENDKGDIQFQSTFFSSIENSEMPALQCDAALNVRAIQPAVLAYQYGKLTEPTASKFASTLGAWIDTWTAASKGEECNKPKYVLPSLMRFPSGAPGGPASSSWQDGSCKKACITLKSER